MEKISNPTRNSIQYSQISRLLIEDRTKEPREKVHNLIFEIGIFSNPILKEWVDITQIQNGIMSEFDLKYYPTEPLKRAAKRLVKKGRVEKKKENNRLLFRLNDNRKNEIEESKKNFKSIDKKITDTLVDRVEKKAGKLSRSDENAVIDVFDNVLASIFKIVENLSVSAILEDGEKKNTLNFKSELYKHLKHIKNKHLRSIVKTELINMFEDPTKEMKKYFIYSANSSFIIKILNLDPECQILEKKLFSNFELILDTNVIISLLFPAHNFHKLTKELIKEANKLSLQLKVTNLTLDEMEKVISSADNLYTDSYISSKSYSYVPEHIIIENFEKLAKNRSEDWDTYVSTIKQYGSKLVKNYDVELINIDIDKIIQDYNIEDIAEIVKECTSNRPYTKTDEVAKHDAYHFALIDKRRKKINEKIWFLSHDSTFSCVNTGFKKHLGEEANTTYYLSCSSFMEIIFPFLSPDVVDQEFEDIFFKIFSSDFFGVAGEFSFGKLTKFFVPLMDEDVLDEEDYTKILEDRTLKRITRQWTNSDYNPKYDETIAKKVAELADERKSQKIKQMEKELEQKQNENEDYRKLLNEEYSNIKSQIRKTENEINTLKEQRDKEKVKKEHVQKLSFNTMCVLTLFTNILLIIIIILIDLGLGYFIGGVIGLLSLDIGLLSRFEKSIDK